MRSRFLVISILISLISCESVNNPPQIIEITCSEADLQVFSGEQVIFDCIATDPDGDEIIYSWTATSGTFNRTNSSAVVWTSPIIKTESIAQIKVGVSDVSHSENQFSIIWIRIDPIPEEPDPDPDPDPEASYYIKYVSDDAYVKAAYPDKNYGTEPILLTGPGYFTYLKFDISDIFDFIESDNLSSIEKVEIRLAKAYNNTLQKPIGTTELYGISWGEILWFEEFITYNIRPQPDKKIAEKENIKFEVDGVVPFNIKTDFLDRVQLHDEYCVLMSTPSPDVSSGCGFYSKELKNRYPAAGDAATPVLWIKYSAE